uniref:RNA methyltransferase-like protein 1 n=1 Tax=Lygus hesperus TaxID=30085 RepID=A0A0A9Z9Q4_LYGHE
MLRKNYMGMVIRWRQSLNVLPARGLSKQVQKTDEDEDDTKPSMSHPTRHAFQKLAFGDTLLSQTMMKVKSKKTREKSGLIMLEGRRIIQEAIDAGCDPTSIFFSRTEDLDMLTLPQKTLKIYKTPYNEMKVWSNLTTPPGIIGIFKKPPPIPETRSSLSLTLICDQIREPGNLGSMIRNCAGVGVRRVILTPGCTDLWDDKVLRGSAGAHFKVRVHSDVDWPEIEDLVKAENSKLLLAAAETSKNGFGRLLPVIPYSTCDYSTSHNFLVIGGETESLSNAAYEVAARTNGSILTIPLANEVESLNSVSAACVIMFEIRKQLKSQPC